MSFALPLGFRFAGVHAGIKRNPAKEDLTLVHCPAGATAAGVYTTNLVYAAPVALDRPRTPAAGMRVIIVNSGNANACTGEQGMADAREMVRLAADAVGADERQALVLSTGVIGRYLPMDRIAAGTKGGCLSAGRGRSQLPRRGSRHSHHRQGDQDCQPVAGRGRSDAPSGGHV
jgi:glutamate N-acetyltransferase / amino-acid N-acetyltransferase